MSRPAPGEPIPIKRGGLRGYALEVYIPRRGGRAHRHEADTFSRALWCAKKGIVLADGLTPGQAYGPLWSDAMAPLVPEGTDAIVYPPAGRRRLAAGYYLARTLAECVAGRLGLDVLHVLRWGDEGSEASKEIVHQGGKGRALGRRVQCDPRLDGLNVCIVDDLFSTGITAQLCAEALRRSGAEVVGIATLGVTERTEWRPQEERERLKIKAEVARYKRGLLTR
jgi:hypothetical protein